jgi:hypothetical protein
MTEDLSVTHLRQFDDTELKPGAGVRQVKRVRYMLGTHGPFEITVDRTADIGEIETAIQAKRAELQRLAQI